MNIYVSNLNFRTRGESLQTLFGEYGEVSSANIITDRETGRSRGFGFVEMPDESAARNAINALNGFELDERAINVNEARPKTERSDRGGYGSNQGGSYGPCFFRRGMGRRFPEERSMAVRSGGRASERGPKLLPGRIVLSLQDAGEIFWPGCLAETVNYAYLCP